ncbi:hypothetical protein H2LOC_020060 [Methylocystis heyeri]|uniref:Glycosyltransferase RgtA/B/C/D-like domain-containing protein n=1 Tax=Methylocystis heyeri TaxID=391905 RepID=A0A6B8KLB3_9HYPH|nr:hypothetical protein H2LOC_020060 [Methylocystis heyeri]
MSNRSIVVFVSVLLFAPALFFAAYLKLAPALSLAVGFAGGLYLIGATRLQADQGFLAAPAKLRELAICTALALVILVVGGETNLFYATYDWRIRDAVLADMVQNAFPVRYSVDGVDYTLRAPLGMYVIPSLIGRGFGLLAAHIALLTQNSLILGGIFYFLKNLGDGWKRLAVMVLFGGLTVIGVGVVVTFVPRYSLHRVFIEGLDAWHPYFQYSSSVVQFFWVPNHALPAWWLAALVLLQTKGEVDTAVIGVSVAGAMFWSPLAILPAVVWLLYLAATDWRAHLLSSRTWWGVVVAACFLPVAVYMTIASSTIAHGIMAEQPNFVALYLFFIAVQLPCLLFLYLNRKLLSKQDRSIFAVNALILLCLPFFGFGPVNDLVMRGSITSLTLIAFVFASTLFKSELSRTARICGWILVVLGSGSALDEVVRNFSQPRYDFSDCSIMEAVSALGGGNAIPTNYLVDSAQIPDWLASEGSAPRSARLRRCWSDYDHHKDGLPAPAAPETR